MSPMIILCGILVLVASSLVLCYFMFGLTAILAVREELEYVQAHALWSSQQPNFS